MSFTDFIMEQWVLFSVLGVLAVTFFVTEARKGITTITHHHATRLLNKGEAILVDVRESKEFKAGHIVDAINIPHTVLAQRIDDLHKHQSKTLILVDKMGQHAGSAGKLLREKGYQVVRMQGGMMEWTQQNLPVVKA